MNLIPQLIINHPQKKQWWIINHARGFFKTLLSWSFLGPQSGGGSRSGTEPSAARGTRGRTWGDAQRFFAAGRDGEVCVGQKNEASFTRRCFGFMVVYLRISISVYIYIHIYIYIYIYSNAGSTSTSEAFGTKLQLTSCAVEDWAQILAINIPRIVSGLVSPQFFMWTLPPLIPLKSPGLFHPLTIRGMNHQVGTIGDSSDNLWVVGVYMFQTKLNLYQSRKK